MSDRSRTLYVVTVIPLALVAACTLLNGCGGSPSAGPPMTAPQLPTITAQVVEFDSSVAATTTPTKSSTVSLSLTTPTVEAELVVTLLTPSATAPNIVENDDCSGILSPYIVLGSGMSTAASETQIVKTYLPRAVGTCTLRFAGAGVEVNVPVSVSP